MEIDDMKKIADREERVEILEIQRMLMNKEIADIKKDSNYISG